MKNIADMFIQELVERKDIPYIDVIAYKNHKQIYRYFCGDGREKVTGKEKLYMYSATKPLTAVCAMRLVEEGKLSLDDKVDKYLPEYKNAFCTDNDGKKQVVGDKMLVYHLITMTAGLTYDYNGYPIKEIISENNGKDDTQTIVNAFIRRPLLFKPVKRFNYSIFHDVLAAVIEKASGKRFSEYMREIIFDPLDMKNSSFYYTDKNIYIQYNCDSDGKVDKIEDKEIERWFAFGKNYESGGAGLVSTVEDYIKFADALACGGTSGGYRLLKENTVKEIYKERLSGISVNNAFTCIQGEDYGYGLGVRVRMKPTEWGLPQCEFGWDGAAGTYLMVDPVNNISVVIGMHIDNWPNIFIGEHLNIVKNIYKNFAI